LFFILQFLLASGLFIFIKFYDEIRVLDENKFIFIKTIALNIIVVLIFCLIIHFINVKINLLNKNIILLFFSKHIYMALILILVPVFIILNSNILEPLTLEYSDNINNRSFSKAFVSEKHKEYTINIKLDDIESDDEKPIRLTVYSYNKNQLTTDGYTVIFSEEYRGKGIETEKTFITLDDTEKILLQLHIWKKDTKIILKSVMLAPKLNQEQKSELLLKNKYLNDSIFNSYKNLFLNKSTLSRSTFYKDGFEIVKESPVLGSGGNAWKYLYQKHQSYGYWSSQAHNYPLQLAIETGLAGLFAFLISIVLLAISFFKNRKCQFFNHIFLIVFLVFIHSTIDFDLSLSSIMVLLWTLISLQLNKKIVEQKIKFENNKYKKLKIPIILMFIVFIISFPIKQFFAQKYAISASLSLEKNVLNSAINNMDKAKQIDKHKPHYYLDYANLLLMQNQLNQSIIDKSKENMLRAERLAYKDFDLLNKILIYNITKTGNLDKSIEIIDRLQELRPHWNYTWELSYNWYWEIIKYKIDNKLDFKVVLDISLSKLEELKETMKKSKSPVRLNQNTQEIIEKIIYFSENEYNYIKADRLVFYSISIDIDSNGIPDQWHDFSNLSYNKKN
jgi:hypothetical protein